MNKGIVMVLLMVLAVSCQQKDILYYITVDDSNTMNCYNQAPIIIPICNEKDSVYCCTLPRSFYNKVGIYLFTE